MCGAEIVKIVLCGGVRNIDDASLVGEGGVYSVSRFPHRGLSSLHHPHSHLHSSSFSSFFLFYFSILFSLIHSIPYRISISLCISTSPFHHRWLDMLLYSVASLLALSTALAAAVPAQVYVFHPPQ